jgi:hypothetical protein
MDFDGKNEAFETRNRNDALAQREAESAGAQRNRLERGSPSAERLNFAGVLNSLVNDAASRELPGLAALEGVRKAQRLGYRTASQHKDDARDQPYVTPLSGTYQQIKDALGSVSGGGSAQRASGEKGGLRLIWTLRSEPLSRIMPRPSATH